MSRADGAIVLPPPRHPAPHHAGGATALTAPIPSAPRRRRGSSALDPTAAAALLLYYADIVDDVEQARIAAAGRLRALTAAPPWGKGVNAALPEVAVARANLDALEAVEAQATRALRAAMRAHPLGPWVAATYGLGEKSAGRWLAAVGDLAARETPSRLWAYCGLHVLHPVLSGASGGSEPTEASPLGGQGEARCDAGGQTMIDVQRPRAPGIAPYRARGTQANWSTDAKKRLYLMAEPCIKHRASPYRAVYDAARARYAEAVHELPCPRCRAAAGDPLGDGHRHARAMRAVMKRIALDAWREARRAAGLPCNKNRRAA